MYFVCCLYEGIASKIVTHEEEVTPQATQDDPPRLMCPAYIIELSEVKKAKKII